MPLKYTIHKSSVHSKGQYRAVVKDVQYATLEDAIRYMTIPGSILKETECRAVANRLFDFINHQLEEGNGFLSPHFILTPGLKGVFEGEDDRFEPKRHQPKVNFRMGKTMRKAIKKMKVEKLETKQPTPQIFGLFDLRTKTYNKMITPEGIAEIKGKCLKITDPDDTAQGVFLYHHETRRYYRIERIVYNYPKKLTFLIPDDLSAGTYQVDVRSAFGKSGEVRISNSFCEVHVA